MTAYGTPQEYQDLYNDKLDREDVKPCRTWDQIDLNLRHDYLDCKRDIIKAQDDQDSTRQVALWHKLKKIDRMNWSAHRARLAGDDALHWRLSYTDSEDPNG